MIDEAMANLMAAEEGEETIDLFASYPQELRKKIQERIVDEGIELHPDVPDWTLPSAQVVIEEMSLNPDDVIAVQHMVFYDEDDTILGDYDTVITNNNWYYLNLNTGSIRLKEPRTTDGRVISDVYGVSCQRTEGSCTSSEWVVNFWFPTCFEMHPDYDGRISGVVDAWFNLSPNCWICCGHPCTYGFCSSKAWPEFGYDGWYSFQDCSPRWSIKNGKQVQKRWYYSLRNCGFSSRYIASRIHTRIEYTP
ncbi:MAG: hypothetical protein ABIE68_01115 [bacterium]